MPEEPTERDDKREPDLRTIVGALWATETEGAPQAVTEDVLAATCAAWTLIHDESTTSETFAQVERLLLDQVGPWSRPYTWQLTALAMEGARDRAVAQRDCLLDVAVAATVLSGVVEDEGTHPMEVAKITEALARYDKLRRAL